MITLKKEAPLENSKKALTQKNYSTKDERLYCRNCGQSAFLTFFDILTCPHGCSFERDYGFMDANERLEWLCEKVIYNEE